MAAGYSSRSLADKLGLRPGQRACLLDEPETFRRDLGSLPPGVVPATTLRGGGFDYIHYFARSRGALSRRLPALVRALASDGMLWLSWPKKASGVDTDLSDGAVRQLGLAAGLVDVKVCAVDEVFSGLKFVYRLADRPPGTRRAGGGSAGRRRL